MKEKLLNFAKDKKNWIIIVLLSVVVLFGLFGGRAVSKFREEIAALKYANKGLELNIADRELQIKAEQGKVAGKQMTIDSCMRAFKGYERKIGVLEKNLSEALEQLHGITSDSSYKFLQEVAYKYPGWMQFLFNETQIKAIHADWIRARGMEGIIKEQKDQISNCTFQFNQRDSVVKHLNKVVELQDKNIKDCLQMNENSKAVISDLEKTNARERRRKGFWRTVSALEPVAFVLLMAL